MTVDQGSCSSTAGALMRLLHAQGCSGGAARGADTTHDGNRQDQVAAGPTSPEFGPSSLERIDAAAASNVASDLRPRWPRDPSLLALPERSHPHQRSVRWTGVSGFAIAAAWASCAIAEAPDVHLARAAAEYDRGHYAEAVPHFRRAAELGDWRSAETLALMYRYGERLYGNQVQADASEAAHWITLAVEGRFGARKTLAATENSEREGRAP